MKIYLTQEHYHLRALTVRQGEKMDDEAENKHAENLGQVLARTSKQDPIKFLPVLDSFLTNIDNLGRYVSQQWGVIEKTGGMDFTFLDYLVEDRNNSTSRLMWSMDPLLHGIIDRGASRYAFTDARAAVSKIIPKIDTPVVILDQGYIFEGVFANTEFDRIRPVRVITPTSILTYEDGLASRLTSIGSLDYDLTFQGRIPREFKTKEVKMEFYASGALHKVTHGGRTWTTTAPTSKDQFTLPDKEGGEIVTRNIGLVRFFKEVGTKNRMVFPDTTGEAYLLNQLVHQILAEKKEVSDGILAAVKKMGHAEARRILMNRIGLKFFLKKAVTLDIDTDSTIHRALVLDKEDDQKYLVCHDGSTKRQYVLSVPTTFESLEVTTCKLAATALAFNSLPSSFSTRELVVGDEQPMDDNFIAES